MKELFKRIFGSSNQRLLNQYSKIVDQINALEDEITSLNDSDLLKKTDELKSLYKSNKDLDNILPLAFAVVREASKGPSDLGIMTFN